MKICPGALAAILPLALNAQEILPSPPSGFQLLYATSFSDGLDTAISQQAPGPESLIIVERPDGGPGKCLRVRMQQAEDFSAVANGSPRSELAFGRQFRIEPGKDYVFEWSTFLPLDHRFDELQPESITQIHQSLSRGSPPFMLTLTGDEYQVEIRGGESESLKTNKHRWGSASGDLGKWVKWRLHYVPDAKGPNAVLHLFKNNIRDLDASGQPNAYAGDTLAYWKLGIYKWGWKKKPSDASSRTIFYRDFFVYVKN